LISNYIVIFFVSLFCISLELFLTRILDLKTWHHIVYVIIPFSVLGYGIGANIYLVFNKFIDRFKKEKIIAFSLLLLGILCMLSITALIYWPIHLSYVLSLFSNNKGIMMLLIAYILVMIPFIVIGFLIVYLFTNDTKASHKLYFFDLIGAGIGAYLFFPLINTVEVFHSLLLLSSIAGVFSLYFFFPRHRMKAIIPGILFSIFCFFIIPEPSDYKIDPIMHWEYIPGHFPKDQYKTLVSRWHPMGRTDVYHFTNEKYRDEIYNHHHYHPAFAINLEPVPDFAFIVTNFLAGTPVFNISKDELVRKNIQIRLFTLGIETPYLILRKPKVVIIGAGGGRDILMAKIHGAQKIVGAEINPVTYQEMSPGGLLYDYSQKIYTSDNTKIRNVDGRHLVKTLEKDEYDLIVLNLVDTLTGLSSGAYTYSESYLYTKNAIIDYLKILNDDGMISMHRWIFREKPRETLRLMAIALDALKTIGIKEPWKHIMIGYGSGNPILIKKSTFTDRQKSIIWSYFEKLDMPKLYPTLDYNLDNKALSFFDMYADAFKFNKIKLFDNYPYDISVITDDRPFFYTFFYKYYKFKLSDLMPSKIIHMHHTGTIVFWIQFLIMLQAVVFILLFIFLPLIIFKKNQIKNLPSKAIAPFITYFSCLGLGFMLIEISLMQKFVLLLGSPIYSLSVTLAVLLISAGIGSYLLPYLEKTCKSKRKLLLMDFVVLVSIFLTLEVFGTKIFDYFMAFPFASRVLIVSLILMPIGMCLGIFFPTGLRLIGKQHTQTIPWAWGLNSGFSVLGGILAISLAQFHGFNFVIRLALVIYLFSFLAFMMMSRYIHINAIDS